PPRGAEARGRVPRSHPARPGPGAAPRLQPERAAGARPRPALGSARGPAARPHPGNQDANGVDTGGAVGERGGSVSIADWRLRIADSRDRKSTRLNSSHVAISYAVFCLKKK